MTAFEARPEAPMLVADAPEDPYTRPLPASVPRRGRGPADAVRARARADAA